jgi:hypothetical protein
METRTADIGFEGGAKMDEGIVLAEVRDQA